MFLACSHIIDGSWAQPEVISEHKTNSKPCLSTAQCSSSLSQTIKFQQPFAYKNRGSGGSKSVPVSVGGVRRK